MYRILFGRLDSRFDILHFPPCTLFRVLFEHQNVKNRLKCSRAEDLIVQQQEDKARLEIERAKMETELREKLRAELLESMIKEKEAESADKPQPNTESADEMQNNTDSE